MNAHESTHASDDWRRPPRLLGRWAVGAAVVAVVTAFVLTGCSGSGEAGPTTDDALDPSPTVSTPAVTPTVTPAPTRTPSPQVTGAPKRPAGMNANTAEGARKTALYFIQLYPYMMRTGDTEEWDRLSVKKQCDFCSETRADAVKIKKQHQIFSGGSITGKVVTTYDRDALYDAYPLDIRVVEQPSITKDRAGKVVKKEGRDGSILAFEVMRVKNGWKILEVVYQGDA